MGRYIRGDIETKLWFAVQPSDAADRFGATGYQPEELVYWFEEKHLDAVRQEIKNIEEILGDFKDKIKEFFDANKSYTDEKLAAHLGVGELEAKKLLREYADLELGIMIEECINLTGQCEFTAEL